MQIPLKQTFSDHLGQPVTLDSTPEGEKLTVRHCLISAVVNEFPEDQKPEIVIQDKLKRFALYQKFQATTTETETLELTADEAAYLKPRIARVFGMIVSGPVMQLLDGQ